MKVKLPTDCGNSPRIIIVGEFVASWAKGDTAAVAEWLAEDVSWTIVGEDTPTSSENTTSFGPLFSPDHLEVHSIVTHGRLASCDGSLGAGGKRVAFSHAIRFAGATKSAKIAEIRSYLIETN